MDSRRFQELLPTAYLVAAKYGEETDEVAVGRIVKDIGHLCDERNLAYLIATSRTAICEIVDVRKDITNFGDVRFEVTYRDTVDVGGPERKAFTPFVHNYRFLMTVEDIWDRFDEEGVNYWVGKEMYLYFHDDPAYDKAHPNLPRDGDHSSRDRSYIVYGGAAPSTSGVKDKKPVFMRRGHRFERI